MQAAMDDIHMLLSVGHRLSPPQTPPLAPVAWGREEAEVLLDEARALLAEGAALLVRPCRAGGRAAEHDPEALGQALELFDAAIAMAPSLKCYAWERGWALYHLNRLPEAREQFEASCDVDEDDMEPWLWRFLCDARLHGVKAAQQHLHEYKGYDRRLCMMHILELFRGQGSVEEVLEGACGDRHSAARASFASALYFEARGDSHLALPLLRAVAELDEDSDIYLYSLAKAHLGRLLRRMAAQGATPHVEPGPLTQALSPKRLNGPYAQAGVVAPLSQSC